jgi:hypothetical protein
MRKEITQIVYNGNVWKVTDKSIVTPAGSVGPDEWLLKLEGNAEEPWDILDWELDDLIHAGIVTIKQTT